jgi:rhamnose utilization protein RhaD (predicted bifunctional aldolase and dehydrogenase)
MSLEHIVELSNYYGSKEEFVLAGGGNTSFKTDDHLYVKASGYPLATITQEGFVKMDRRKLAQMWRTTYPSESGAREAAVLQDMMAARCAGEEEKRPSVETLLHDALPQTYVVHTHPALVNGLTCGRDGEAQMQRLFGGSAVWVPIVNPGYVLAVEVRDAVKAHEADHGNPPELIFLQNHGVFVSADQPAAIREHYEAIVRKLQAAVHRQPDFSPVSADPARVQAARRAIATAYGNGDRCIHFETNRELQRLVADREHFEPLSSAYTPDHIVYAGHEPLFVPSPAAVQGELDAYRHRNGNDPTIVAVQGLGAFGVAADEKAAGRALLLLLDAAKIAVYSESFGGHQFMPQDQIDFIRNWEVERYRKKVSS